MVGMVLVLIAVVVVAVLAALMFLRLRPRGGDLESVRSYHSALGTLEHLSDRTGQSPVRVVSPPGRPAGAGVGQPREAAGAAGVPAVPPVPVRGSDEFPDPGSPLVFDDARPADRPRIQPSTEGPATYRVDRAQRHALESMNHRPRRITAVLLVAVVLVLVAGLAYAGSKRSKSTGHPATTSAVASGSTRPTATSPASAASDRHARGSGEHHKVGDAKKVPAAAHPTRIVAVSTSASSATFPVDVDAYLLSLTASAPCWVLARSASSGATLWTGTMVAGGRQTISATGAVTLELGAPTVAVTVDQVPVVLPTPFHTPFLATFQPAASTASTTTTTTSSPLDATSTTVGNVPASG